MANYSSASEILSTQQGEINKKLNEYINIKNAVRILELYSNWNGYIKLQTEVESNFDVGDIVYITYTSGVTPVNVFNLENPSIPYSTWSNGYTILYVNKLKNEIVINRNYNDITSGYLLKNQYISKVSVRGGTFTGGVIDGLIFYQSDIEYGVTFSQGVFMECNISNIHFPDKYKLIKTLYATESYVTPGNENNVS